MRACAGEILHCSASELRARIAALEEALRPLADFAYRFVAYPQGLAGRDPLMGILKHDVETLRLLAKHGADALIDKPVTASERPKE